MASPAFDGDAVLRAQAEPLDAQAFVAQGAVEALAGAVRPRFPGLEQGGSDFVVADPMQQGEAEQLGTMN